MVRVGNIHRLTSILRRCHISNITKVALAQVKMVVGPTVCGGDVEFLHLEWFIRTSCLSALESRRHCVVVLLYLVLRSYQSL